MESSQQFARFLKWSLGVTAAGAVVVAALVAAIDPYRLFGVVDVIGFNHRKPQPEQYREEIKVAQARAMRANALFLGNSRIEYGVDPDSPQLAAHGYSAYNLALSGTGLVTAQHAFAGVRGAATPSMVLLGVEFQDFLIDPAGAARPAAPKTPSNRWQWRLDTVFSMTSALDALTTLRIQDAAEAETMTPRGLNPLAEYTRYAREEGYYAIFQQRALENAKTMVHRPHGLTTDGSDSSVHFERLHQMLGALAADHAEVNLVIYPYHAQLLAMFEAAGLWPAFEQWKHLLLRQVDAVRRAHPGARITLWDFSGFWPIQCETIPARGDTRNATRWYWEAGHFKQVVGEMILSRVMGGSAPIGQSLTEENFEQDRERIAAERARCVAAYPEVFRDAAAMIAAARPSGQSWLARAGQ